MGIYLDDLKDSEIAGALKAIIPAVRKLIAGPHGRTLAAVQNELSTRAQARGLFEERTGQWTEKGKRALKRAR